MSSSKISDTFSLEMKMINLKWMEILLTDQEDWYNDEKQEEENWSHWDFPKRKDLCTEKWSGFYHTEIISDSRVVNNGETEVERLFFVVNDWI
jgi:hypothetical protein